MITSHAESYDIDTALAVTGEYFLDPLIPADGELAALGLSSPRPEGLVFLDYFLSGSEVRDEPAPKRFVRSGANAPEETTTDRGRLEVPPLIAAPPSFEDCTFEPRTFDALMRAYRPVSPEVAAYWLSTTDFVRERLADGASRNPVVAASLQHLLLTAYLHVFPAAGAGTLPLQEEDRLAPATLRRAKTFIEEHAHEPVTVADIAHAARMSTRGLQEAFRRVFDTTPMAYLNTVRLAGAKGDLLNANPLDGDTVSDIARRWGFTHLGRFSTRYRETHGESPSTTLRR